MTTGNLASLTLKRLRVLIASSYYESASNLPVEVENFALSKTRLNKKNIVYADKHTLCVRIKEKMVGIRKGDWKEAAGLRFSRI